ncbi:UDP-N-acetylmuramate--L-alanine ligase [Candidatus Saccharibacteria bacterium]|nr:UDP-N-acetylmuramate--L-alanine ligase [Candidatus Saccharibacteria bacterium]
MTERARHVHFIAIGGIGVSALAQWYLAQGYKVSGSDAVSSETTDFLMDQGVTIYIGHHASHIDGADEIIHSAAVKAGNPEYDAAKKRGIKMALYAEALGLLTRQYSTIAVAGSHGKSTTTAMVAIIMIAAGLDPTVVVGTKVKELDDNNFRHGGSKWLVLEADEYNRHFHHYYPQIAVINNIDLEHLEIYPDLESVEQSFLDFANNVRPEGVLVANGQDKSVTRLLKRFDSKNRTVVVFNGTDIAKHNLSIPGGHNQSNAEAAFRVGKALGIAEPSLRKSLHGFKGSWRRLEEVSEGIYSDYGHHPTEVKASLQALREANPNKRLVCVFQPHQHERLSGLFNDFVAAFEAADMAIIIPLYTPQGRDSGAGKGSEDLVRAIGKDGVLFAPNFNSAYATASKLFDQNHIIVFMGAGDIDESLRAKLAEQHLI